MTVRVLRRIEWIVRSRRGPGVRSALAWSLRSMADRIDRMWSVAVYVRSEPDLPHTEVVAALSRGIEHSMRLYRESVHWECTEAAMRKLHPELFEEDQ